MPDTESCFFCPAPASVYVLPSRFPGFGYGCCLLSTTADLVLIGCFRFTVAVYSNCAALLAVLAACYTHLYYYISYKIYTR